MSLSMPCAQTTCYARRHHATCADSMLCAQTACYVRKQHVMWTYSTLDFHFLARVLPACGACSCACCVRILVWNGTRIQNVCKQMYWERCSNTALPLRVMCQVSVLCGNMTSSPHIGNHSCEWHRTARQPGHVFLIYGVYAFDIFSIIVCDVDLSHMRFQSTYVRRQRQGGAGAGDRESNSPT